MRGGTAASYTAWGGVVVAAQPSPAADREGGRLASPSVQTFPVGAAGKSSEEEHQKAVPEAQSLEVPLASCNRLQVAEEQPRRLSMRRPASSEEQGEKEEIGVWEEVAAGGAAPET